MKQPFFIAIDDVYDDPDKVREYALNCEYRPYKTCVGGTLAQWEGKESVRPYPWSGKVTRVASEATRKTLYSASYVNGKFRITKGSERGADTAHYDCLQQERLYIGILYLNKLKPWQSISGTILYKDALKGISFATEHGTYPADRKTLHKNEYWIPHIISNIVYNRLIIYDSSYFHAAGQPFGDTDDEARLVQIFFWTEDEILG